MAEIITEVEAAPGPAVALRARDRGEGAAISELPECHPACLLLPEMSEAEYRDLVDDIRQHGQRHAIIVDETGAILDGRHRWRAAEELGLKPQTSTFHGSEGEKVALVMSENIHRRHLTVEQRAHIAVDLSEKLTEAAKQRQLAGRPLASNEAKGKAAEQAAKMVGVSTSSVERAKKIKRTDPEAHALAKASRKAPKPKLVGGDRKRLKVKPPKLEPPRETGTYTTVGDFLQRYEVPTKGAIGVDVAWLRHAPVGDVVTWAAATLGDDRVLELVAALQQVIDVRASAQAS
jgi:hypothetical protein